MVDIARIRADFRILERTVNGKPLVYLDSAATALKPRQVVDAIATHYDREAANVHRGVHYLSEQATQAFEAGREAVRRFLNAPQVENIIFTKGTTDSINIVARCYGDIAVSTGDEVVISAMEHHSNIVPWQMLCERRGAKLRVIPVHDDGSLDMVAYGKLLCERTRIVSTTHISNALGTINPVAEIVRMAHGVGAKVVIDAAQSTPHEPVDVQALDADFLAFSGHKLYGPTGIGILYGKPELLDAMPPLQGGGAMIDKVTFEKTTYAAPPLRFEAGTPHIAGVIGLKAAIEYVEALDWPSIETHEAELLRNATEQLSAIPGLRLIGTSPHKSAIVSFVIDGAHPHDIGTLVDQEGVAIRTGHHCTQPLMARFGVTATARASFAMYSRHVDVDVLVGAVKKACSFLR